MTGELNALVGEAFSLDRRLMRLGFRLWHIGGVSKAWRKFDRDGGYVLVTDVGGCDLPEENGPFLVWAFTTADDLQDDVLFAGSRAELLAILTHPKCESDKHFSRGE